MSTQKRALSHFKKTGSFEGFQQRTVEALARKKHIKESGSGWEITKRGEAMLAGRLGGLSEIHTMRKTRTTDVSKSRQGKKPKPRAAPGALDGLARKIYDLVLKNTKHGQAWNSQEIAKKLAVEPHKVAKHLADLSAAGLIHSPGADLFGDTWMAVVPSVGLFSNPSTFEESEAAAARRSRKAAERWYGDPALVDSTKILRSHKFPKAFLDAGEISAIEYESDKFDGESRIYRHEVTKKRRLIISADGSTILVQPPFKITKRGIEG